MRKILWSFLVLMCITLPWACSSYPTSGYSTTRTGPYYTPTPSPTFAVPTPAYISSWSTAGGPNGLALGMGTTVYVAEGDGGTAQVEVFDSSNPASALATWTAYGPTRFEWPIGVAVHPVNGNVYVLDNQKNAVYEFNSAGTTVTSWTGYGSKYFYFPGGIAIDSSANCNGGPCLYVADTGNNEVDEFDQNGTPINHWNSTSGPNPVFFLNPTTVAVDASNNVYVADDGNGTIDEFSPGGSSTLAQFPEVGNAYVQGLAVNGGNIYAADYGDGTGFYGNGLVEEFDPTGDLLTAWSSNQGTYVFGPDAVLFVGSNILVADWNNDLIQVF